MNKIFANYLSLFQVVPTNTQFLSVLPLRLAVASTCSIRNYFFHLTRHPEIREMTDLKNYSLGLPLLSFAFKKVFVMKSLCFKMYPMNCTFVFSIAFSLDGFYIQLNIFFFYLHSYACLLKYSFFFAKFAFLMLFSYQLQLRYLLLINKKT